MSQIDLTIPPREADIGALHVRRILPMYSIRLEAEYAERALYLVKGGLRIGEDRVAAATMPVFASGDTVTIEAEQDSTVMLLGGDPLAEPRYIDWNFVSSSKERLLQARDDWRHQRFGKIPGDDKEFVPLP